MRDNLSPPKDNVKVWVGVYPTLLRSEKEMAGSYAAGHFFFSPPLSFTPQNYPEPGTLCRVLRALP